MKTVLNLVVAGDLVLDEPDAGHWLSGIAPAVRMADLAIAHLEVPHTTAVDELPGDVPAPGAPPKNVAAIAEAGFAAVSLAGNHIADCGPQGIADTRNLLAAAGVAFAGAGPNLTSARTPAFLESGGWRIALLSYNCVGPEAGWATASSAGAAYLPIRTKDGSPVTPTAPLVGITEEGREILRSDIAAARENADLVLVALHKGIVHRPSELAPYERELAQATIDAGADVVMGHHSHIVRGIEFHRGKPIFHGLGNACVVTRALSPGQDHPARAEWVERRKRLFGFEPDPAYTLAPFHPEAVNAMLGMLRVSPDGMITAGIIPVDVEAPGRPVIPGSARAHEIRRYIQSITVAAGLPPVTIDHQGWVMAA